MKGVKASSHRRRGEVGIVGMKFLLQLFFLIQFGGIDYEYNDSKKMQKRKAQGYREPSVTAVESRGGTRSGMLITTDGGVGNKEVRRSRKMK